MGSRGGRRKFTDKNGKDSDDGFDKWGGYMAAKQAKLLDQFHNDAAVEKVSNIFAGIRILVNGLTHPPAVELKNLMAAHGGEYHMYQCSTTTHIIASNLPNVKIKHLGAVPVVKPAWITESIALNKLLDYKRYLLYTNQSRLQPALNFEVLAKPSTSAGSMDFENDADAETSAVEEDTEMSSVVSSSGDVSKSEVLKRNPASRITKTASDPRFLEEFYSNSRLHLISTLGAEFKQLVAQLRETSNGIFPGREKLKAEREKLDSAERAVPSSVIMHIDMDCFFVSVGLRSRPELRGKPVAITHAKSGVINSTDPDRQAIRDREFALYEARLPEGSVSRVVDVKEKIDGLASMSEIASCSYEARRFGLKNGMFLGQAVKLCPELKTLPYDFDGYKEVSNALYKTVADYTLDIEAVSCDEMYVDIKRILTDTGLSVEEWAAHIRREIMDVTGCPCSTGFGANRLQARLATKKAKPAGQYYLKPEDVHDYISVVPLAELPGVGRATVAKLKNLGYITCGDLREGSLKLLQAELGSKLGERIWEQAHGHDNKPLDFNHERKSVSAEINYGIRFKTKEECYNFLESLSIEVFSRLSDINMKARGLTLKLLVRAEGAPVETAKFLGHGVCDVITKSSTSNAIYANANSIYKEAKSIYDRLNAPFSELRGVGIQLTKLEKNAPTSKALSKFLLREGDLKKEVKESVSTGGKALPLRDQNSPETPLNNKSEESSRNNLKTQSTCVRGKKRETGTTMRGRRGRKQTAVQTSTMKTFLNRKKNDSLTNSAMESRHQIDFDVLNELPEDIRKEVMKEYRLEERSNVTPGPCEASASVKSGERVLAESLTSLSVPTTNPFSNQSWEQIKQAIKVWIETVKEPASVDVTMLAEQLRQMAMDRRIELLQSGFNFLHRKFSDLTCPWHQAYFVLVNAVQQGMVARYGKTLHLQRNFSCCNMNECDVK